MAGDGLPSRGSRQRARLRAAGFRRGGLLSLFPSWASQGYRERTMARHEIDQILERAIAALPDPFRVVLAAHLVVEMSIEGMMMA